MTENKCWALKPTRDNLTNIPDEGLFNYKT